MRLNPTVFLSLLLLSVIGCAPKPPAPETLTLQSRDGPLATFRAR